MRIVFLSVSDQLGGSEVALADVLRGLRAARPGWHLDVILPGQGPLLGQLEALGVGTIVIPQPAALARLGESALAHATHTWAARGMLAAQLAAAAIALPAYEARVRAVLLRLRPRVLHTNGLKAHVVGARVAPAGTALVWHLHEYVGTRPVTRRLLRHYRRRCAAIIANSASVATDARHVLGRQAPVTVIHNGVDLETFTPEGRRSDLDALCGHPPAAPGTVRVGLVATMGKWKGHEVFLRALAALPPDLAVRGYVIGGPVYDTRGSQHTREELERLAARLGLERRVGFTGFVPSADAMRALDVVVHASTRPEPFGLVLAEAMATGRALISTALGGAAEVIEPDVDAVVCRPGDASSLAEAIARVAADASLRSTLAEQARRHACLKFDRRRLGVEVSAVYERLAGAVRAEASVA